MHQIELGFTAILMRSSLDARRAIQKNDDLRQLREISTELRWNARIFHHATNLLDEETLLVICPAGKWGARVKIIGVTCNFQV